MRVAEGRHQYSAAAIVFPEASFAVFTDIIDFTAADTDTQRRLPSIILQFVNSISLILITAYSISHVVTIFNRDNLYFDIENSPAMCYYMIV